jgi:hypothetical protein
LTSAEESPELVRLASSRLGPGRAAGGVAFVLAAVAGLAIVGGSSNVSSAAVSAASRAPSLAAQVRATPSIDPATLEGASALARSVFVIPPPRWLVSHRRPGEGPRTARLGGLGWQTDPYED